MKKCDNIKCEDGWIFNGQVIGYTPCECQTNHKLKISIIKQALDITQSKCRIVKIWFRRKYRQLHGWKEYQSEEFDKENGIRLIINAMANPKTGQLWIYKEQWLKLKPILK